MNNLILCGDSYKYSHHVQYPQGLTKMFSYFESRGSNRGWDNTIFFGLQYLLKEYLTRRISVDNVLEAEKFMRLHGVPFNFEGWMYIAKELGGKIPVRIRAVPEGSVVPNHNILCSIESTDEKVPWIANFLETLLVQQLWYGCTVATQSYHIKKIIKGYLEDTAENPEEEVSFKLHDFGCRGVSSTESAMIGGAAHLVNFQGSDTVPGIWMANKYYNCEMAAQSIPASEHSTITMWGKENEAQAYSNMLEQYQDCPMFACVSDSYDIFNAVSNLWGGELLDKVKEYKGTLVIRPDSGEPAKVVVEVLERLEKAFGATINSKGYKVINHNVRVIQGDGIDQLMVDRVLAWAKWNQYSATNIVFGSGGALLQKVCRDDQKFAFKCSWAMVDGKEVEVYKEPITDPGKKSKRGKLDLNLDGDGCYSTVKYPAENSALVDVYLNGEILKEYTFEEIRNRASGGAS